MRADGPSIAQLRSLARKPSAEGVDEEDGEAWVPLASFLRAVGKAKEVAQAKRFIANKMGKRWLRPDGGRPRVNTEYKYRKGVHGGGVGAGVLHVRLSRLRCLLEALLLGIEVMYWQHYHHSSHTRHIKHQHKHNMMTIPT